MCKRDLIIGLLIGTSALFLAGKAVAIERVTWVGARESGLSQAMAAVPGPFSVFNNQAFLTENTIPIVAISYRQPYFIPGYHDCRQHSEKNGRVSNETPDGYPTRNQLCPEKHEIKY